MTRHLRKTLHCPCWPAHLCRLGHGTHVNGIVGATGNNSAGIAGVNWEVGEARGSGVPGAGWGGGIMVEIARLPAAATT